MRFLLFKNKMDLLEKIFKKTSNFILNLLQSVVSIFKIGLLYRKVSAFPSSKNSECMILGNGPSLSTSLSKGHLLIDKCDIICVNRFAETPYYELIKPKYYCLHDPLFHQHQENDGDVYQLEKFFFSLINKTSWKIFVFLPLKAKKYNYIGSLNNLNSNINLVYYNYIVYQGFSCLGNLLYKNKYAMPRCTNVLASSLVLAINLKYKNVYLVGADHSWHEELKINENKDIVGKQLHFYDREEAVLEDSIVSENMKSNKKVQWIHSFFLNMYKTFHSYVIINQYAHYQGVRIINVSEKSYIDAFEKKTINELIP